MVKTRLNTWIVLLVAISLVLTSCGGGGQTQPAQPDYKSTKSMVLDILQTSEAKKEIGKMMKDEKFQQSVMLNSDTVRTTLIQSIAKPNNPQIKEAFKDPKFTSTLAKAMKEENKKLLKDLMKDPEYQKMMIEVMKDPEFQKTQMDIFKTSAYRQQTMKVMKEALQSPLFQAELMKIMESVAEDMTTPKSKKAEKKKKKEDSGGGS